MKQLIYELYNESIRELEKIHKSKLLLSERVAIEKAITKLEAMRKVLSYCNVTPGTSN